MAVPALLFAAAKHRVLLRIVSSVAAIMAPVLIMVMCGSLAMAALATQESTTACLTTASTVANTVSPSAPEAGTGAGLSIPSGSASGSPAVLTAAQVSVARAYIGVGQALAVSDAGMEIAIMMAMQESGLRILANGSVPASLAFDHDGVGSDHDSLGSAQQRPSAGWGTVAQLMNPVYNAQAFFGGPSGPNQGSPPGLLDIAGWELMAKGDAAQAVQVSAFPELYAQWDGTARAIVAALKSGAVVTACSIDTAVPGTPPVPGNLSPLRRNIIENAQKGVGGTYVWGGTAFKSWDCSGYVQWIYEQVGIKLPRTEQWLAGTPTSSPQPGDLVVQNPDGPNHWGHVGIYAGDGMMYSALNPAVGTLVHPVAWNPGAQYFVLLSAQR